MIHDEPPCLIGQMLTGTLDSSNQVLFKRLGAYPVIDESVVSVEIVKCLYTVKPRFSQGVEISTSERQVTPTEYSHQMMDF